MNDQTRVVALFLLAGLGLLLFASPVGDWVGNLIKRQPFEAPKQIEAMKLPLPVLKVKKDLIKTPGESPGQDEAKLPIPKIQGRKGTLGNDEIEQTISQKQTLFQRCWTQRLKDSPGLIGNVLMQFEIHPRGKVQNVQVAQSSITDEMMLRCLTSVLERISFREFTGGAITLTFPLSFE